MSFYATATGWLADSDGVLLDRYDTPGLARRAAHQMNRDGQTHASSCRCKSCKRARRAQGVEKAA